MTGNAGIGPVAEIYKFVQKMIVKMSKLIHSHRSTTVRLGSKNLG
jgi:hypothetical protein